MWPRGGLWPWLGQRRGDSRGGGGAVQAKVTSAAHVAERARVSDGTGSWRVSGSLCTSNWQARAAISQVTDTSLASGGSVSGKGVLGKVAGWCLHVLGADNEASAIVPDAGQMSDQKWQEGSDEGQEMR